MSIENATEDGLTIERVFDAPVEMVYKAWSDPEMIKKWWGPRGFSAPTVKIDFKVGGKYLLEMKGSPAPGVPEMDAWSGGYYKEIIPPNPSVHSGPNGKIVVMDSFTDPQGNQVHASHYGLPESFPLESEIIISFESMGDKTKMTLHYPSIKGIEGPMLDNMTQGWNQSLDKLAEMLNN